MISKASLRFEYRLLFTGITVSLALLSYATSMDLAVQGFIHRLLTSNTPPFILAYKLSTSTRIAFDVMVTIALTISLHLARSKGGLKNSRTDHVITIMTLFTVNTNLITTCLSISELVTFLALPKATVYGGIGFLSTKTYSNTFLAVLNSRDYLREKFDKPVVMSTSLRGEAKPTFAILPQHSLSGTAGSSTAASASGGAQYFELSPINQDFNSKPNTEYSNSYGPGLNTTAPVREFEYVK